MNNFQNENAAMQTKEEFDRSMCMSFFDDHRKLVKRIERMQGIEMAYRVQNLIIDYGLDGVMPKDEELLQFVPEPVLNQIDQNQKRRSKGFQGENLEVSRSIILLHRDRPDLSQNAIAKELGVSKGKVNKTLQKYKNGEYEGIINLDDTITLTNTFTSTSTSTITNTGLTSDQRDRMTTCQTELAVAQTDASLEEEEKEEEKRELVISCFQKGMSYKKDKPEIQNYTGLSGKVIYNIIQEYYEEMKENENKTCIPLMNGKMSEYYIEDFDLRKESLPNFYPIMVGEDSEYNFKKEFVDNWLLEKYDYVHNYA